MTEKLKTLMDRAVDVDFAMVDLDLVVTSGDRVVRRRRAALGVAVVATAAVVGGVAVLAAGDGVERGDDNPPVTGRTVDGAGMSWGVGAEIRTPSGTIAVGHPVRAHARTGAGFVTVDDAGEVWSVVGDEVTAIGRSSASPRLVTDTEAPLAAWLEPTATGEGQVVVYDQQRERRVVEVPAGPRARVAALDAGELYLEQDGAHRVIDVATGEEWDIAPSVPGSELLAVEDGALVWASDDGYVIERDATAPVRIDEVAGGIAVLSPDGRRVSFDADELRVHDTATGERLPVDVDGRVFAAGYEWLDADRFAAIASRGEEGPAELLACSVAERRCDQVVPDLGGFEELASGGFSLPVGTALDEE